MRKCCGDEVPALVVSLDEQCAEWVQFNWPEFLCEEFSNNCKEAQEQGKPFHYAWFLLSIPLVVGEMPEENQFPRIAQDLPEAAKYALLWATKDATKISEVLMEVSV